MKTRETAGLLPAVQEKNTGTSPRREFMHRAPPEGPRTAPESGGAVVGLIPNEKTILLAEDCLELRGMLLFCLRGEGFIALEAENGEQALRTHEEHEGPIHLLVTDLMMPKMGGLELAERVRSLRPEICVLYMSGCMPDRLNGLPLSDVGKAFIQKPFGIRNMVREIRLLLHGQDQRAYSRLPGNREEVQIEHALERMNIMKQGKSSGSSGGKRCGPSIPVGLYTGKGP